MCHMEKIFMTSPSYREHIWIAGIVALDIRTDLYYNRKKLEKEWEACILRKKRSF